MLNPCEVILNRTLVAIWVFQCSGQSDLMDSISLSISHLAWKNCQNFRERRQVRVTKNHDFFFFWRTNAKFNELNLNGAMCISLDFTHDISEIHGINLVTPTFASNMKLTKLCRYFVFVFLLPEITDSIKLSLFKKPSGKALGVFKDHRKWCFLFVQFRKVKSWAIYRYTSIVLFVNYARTNNNGAWQPELCWLVLLCNVDWSHIFWTFFQC